MKWLWIALFIPLAACASKVVQNDPNVPLGNYYQVTGDAYLYRSAQPDHAGMLWLANNGFKTIINVNDNSSEMASEAQDARALGINEIQVPLASFATPSDEDIAKIEQSIDPTAGKILVHCEHGQDRTGLVIGLHRVIADRWAAQKAHDEMLQYGFHTILVPLDDYFWDHSKVIPQFHN